MKMAINKGISSFLQTYNTVNSKIINDMWFRITQGNEKLKYYPAHAVTLTYMSRDHGYGFVKISMGISAAVIHGIEIILASS